MFPGRILFGNSFATLVTFSPMLQIIHAGDVLLPLLYALSLGLYWSYFLGENPTLGKAASRFLLLGILIHILILSVKWAHFEIFPIADVFASLSLLALAVAIIYYFIERTIKEGRTGVFFLGIVFLFQLVSSLFINYTGARSVLLSDPKFGVHTTFTLLGISSLAIAALYGFMYIMLAKQIRSHRFGPIYAGLPSLEILEEMGRYATAAGIILLGIGILLGHLWAYKVLGYFFKFDSKIIITDLAWLAYLSGWVIVKKINLSGMRISMLYMWGFVVFFLSIMVVNLFGDSFHKFI